MPVTLIMRGSVHIIPHCEEKVKPIRPRVRAEMREKARADYNTSIASAEKIGEIKRTTNL